MTRVSFDYAEVIRQYKALRPEYEHLAAWLQDQLQELCKAAGITPIIFSRAKSLESFADKICRTGKSYSNPIAEITDLCGVRVIVHTTDEVEDLVERINSAFVIDEKNSIDKQDELDIDSFGYLSQHFIVRATDIPEQDGRSSDDFSTLKNPRAEIQLRTLAQHAWADNYHELGYKNEFALPARWQREFAGLAASLESCDKVFMDIKHSMATYESNYGAYMSQDELDHLAKRLEILAIEDPGNTSVLHRLIRAYSSLDGKLEKLESLFVNNSDCLCNSAPALRDVGVVLCRHYPAGSDKFHVGQNHLERAVELDPVDVDALSSLGGVYRRAKRYNDSLDCYRRAHLLDNTNPYPLLNYIAAEVVRTGDADVVQNFYAPMELAKERCKKQIEVGVNLPWSSFDMGQIALYMGDTNDSIAWFAKGIDQSSSSWMLRSARQPILAILSATKNLNGSDIVACLLGIADQLKRVLNETSDIEKTNNSTLFSDAPILLVSGGCSSMEDCHSEQLSVMAGALADYQGTIVSGGTNVGVPGVVGLISDNSNHNTIGYLPSKEMSGLGDLTDTRYDILRHTIPNEFSIAVALQFWEDFLSSGRQPTTLKLIGFNGGDISAAEYRVALALGARVGIVSGSGREADVLLHDELWSNHPGLYVLESNVKSILEFLDN